MNKEEVPEGWESKKLMLLVDYKKGKKPKIESEESKEGYTPYLNTEYLRNDKPSRYAKITKDMLLANDKEILLLWDGSNAGEFFQAKKGAISSTMVKFIIKDSVSQQFLFYQLKTHEPKLKELTQGTGIPHVDKIFLTTRDILYPKNPEEQKKIASILSKVDYQIEITEDIIGKTEKLKKGLIQQLLTKGIGQSEFKETDIGEIPKKWQVQRLNKITTKIGDGLHATPKYVDSSEYYFINGNNLVNGKIKITERTKCVNQSEYEKYLIELGENTILLSINGTIGNIAYYNNEKVILGKSAAYINCNENANKNFISMVLQSSRVKKYFFSELTGTTIKNLSLKTIRNTKIQLPDLDEQNKISSIIISTISDIENNKRELNRLKELKKGLMRDLLTGKARVKV